MEVRKILSQEEKERISTRNKRIMGIILGLIMLLSTAGYFVMDFTNNAGGSQKDAEYNGIKFKQDAYGYWAFQIQGFSFSTQYIPSQTENISVLTNKTIGDYSGKNLYFSGEPGAEHISQAASQEILKNIGNFIQRVNYACLKSNCTADYPVKNCSSDRIIIFKESQSNKTILTDKEMCVIIEYSEFDDIRVADSFIFRILGIK